MMSRTSSLFRRFGTAAAAAVLLLATVVVVTGHERSAYSKNSTRSGRAANHSSSSRSTSSLRSYQESPPLQDIAFDYDAISRRLQSYKCGPQGTFTFRLPALFFGSPTQTTGNEFVVLQDSFQGQYNALATDVCDPNYRSIQAVSVGMFLDGGGGRRRRLLQRRRHVERRKQQGRRRLQPGTANGEITGTGSCGTASACDSSLFRGGFGQRRRLGGEKTEKTSAAAALEKKKTLRSTSKTTTTDEAASLAAAARTLPAGRELGYRYPNEDDSNDADITSRDEDNSSTEDSSRRSPRSSSSSSSADACPCRSKAMMMSSSSRSRPQPTFQQPTEDEFEVIYNQDIRLLNDAGSLRSVNRVDLGAELYCRCQAPPPPSRSSSSSSMMSSSSSRRRLMMGTRGSRDDDAEQHIWKGGYNSFYPAVPRYPPPLYPGAWDDSHGDDDWQSKKGKKHHPHHSGHKKSKKHHSKPRYSSESESYSSSYKIQKKHRSKKSRYSGYSYGHSYHAAGSGDESSYDEGSHNIDDDKERDYDQQDDEIRIIPYDEYPCACEYRDEFFAQERNQQNNNDDDDEHGGGEYSRRRCGSGSSSHSRDGTSNQNLDYLQEVFLCPAL
jgi:hypothetical protein